MSSACMLPPSMLEPDFKPYLACLHEWLAGELQGWLWSLQRSQTISFWRDHSRVLGHGCIFMTVQVAYDLAVFMTESEYLATSGKAVQFFSKWSKSLNCTLFLIIHSPAGHHSRQTWRFAWALQYHSYHRTEVTDALPFYIGDHPIQQFERGTVGGTYKCGSCGCLDASQYKWCSLPTLVLAGKHGNKVGTPKAFSGLKSCLVRSWLAWSRYTFSTDWSVILIKQVLGDLNLPAVLLQYLR